MTINLCTWMSRGRLYAGVALAVALLAAAPALAAPEDGGSYGYLRVVDGPANLVQAESETRTEAEINQPLLAGDRLWVPNGSRVEAVLADGNLLRIDGGSEIVLQRLAGSPDGDDPQTVLELREGNVQLVVFEDALGDDLPRVDTPNATFYVQRPGSFRLTSDQGTWSAFVVRDGSAEVVTERGSVVVRADEEAVVEGEKFPRAAVQAASGRDALERWAVRLDEEAERYASRGELGDLAYQGATLGRYGSWHSIGHRRIWRPTVDAGWRPYWNGRWAYTPAGLTWISYEPWGWVPYHYGSWDFIPGWGWGWEPGRVWAPSWVYWYWGPRYVSWCPVGYYTRHYGYPGYRDGIYGWAGGHWGGWDDWTFVDVDHIGRRDQHAYSRKGRDIKDQLRDLQRGIITTDTRGVTPERWKNPESVLRVLQERGKGSPLPDVTPFVARQPKLPPGVLRTVQADRPEKLDGTPLKPDTLGRVGKLRGQGDTGWATPRGDGGRRPTIQLGGSAGSGRGQVRGGSATSDAGESWRERGSAGAGSGRTSGKTWDRPAAGGTTGDRGPRVKLPERGDSGSASEPAQRPKTWDRPAESDSDKGDRGPRIRLPESGSGGSRPEPRVREPESGSRGDDGGGRSKAPEQPAPEPPRERSEPRVKPSDPPQARSAEPAKSWRPEVAPRSSEPRLRERPDVRSRPVPEYRPSRPAPEARPSRPAPEYRPAPQPSSPKSAPAVREDRGSRGGNDGGRGGNAGSKGNKGNSGGESGRSHGRVKPPKS